ncbi:Histidinol dehydrogenase [Pluralibacter gergoviae]|nr:Histidinol dehydrogenase [Pluralibacter gergoviae]
MSFSTIIDWNDCSADQQRELLMRPGDRRLGQHHPHGGGDPR